MLVRVDADPSVGAGHAVRCLALVQAWVDAGGDAAVCTRSLTEPHRSAFEHEGVEVIDLRSDDVAEVQHLVERRRPNWLVVDGYAFGAVRPAPGSATRTLVIDDHGASQPVPSELLLDQNLVASAASYPTMPPDRLLLGPSYALLRRWFRTQPQPVRAAKPGTLRVLLTLGGAPPPGLAERLLGLAATLRAAGHDVVAAGAGLGEHGAWLPDLPEHLSEFDLAVTASGSITWELCWAGVPMVLLPIATNQEPIADALCHAGAAVRGEHLDDTVQALIDDPDGRLRMATEGQRLVDGRGADRVVQALHAG